MRSHHLPRRSLLVGAACACALPGVGIAAPVSFESLEPLRDEPSRQQIFAYHAHRDRGSDDDLGRTDVPRGFTFPFHARMDGHSSRKDTVFGLDLSHHNRALEVLDFGKLRENLVDFVYLKATQGASFVDPHFTKNWAALDRLAPESAVFKGAYHFLSSSSNATDQAAAYVAALRHVGYGSTMDLMPVLDVEWDSSRPDGTDRWRNRTIGDITQSIRSWARVVRNELGRKTMLYTNAAWWKERGGSMQLLSDVSREVGALWIANYSAIARAVELPMRPKDDMWSLWQFTDVADLSSAARTSPPAEGFDANLFRGQRSDLSRLSGT